LRILAGFLLALSASLSFAQDYGPTRLEPRVQEFEAADKLNPPPKNAIVIAGSSTIKMWSTASTDLAPLVIIRRGLSGSLVADWAYYLERMVLVYQPHSVVLYVGDNDIGNGLSPQSVVTGLTDIARRISARYPSAKIYFIAIKPSPARWSKWSASQEANRLVKLLADADPRYFFIDPNAALFGSDGKLITSYYSSVDQLHFTPSGYVAWVKGIRPVILANETATAKKPYPPANVRVDP
jgi:lysophospholipase L1-like esterase